MSGLEAMVYFTCVGVLTYNYRTIVDLMVYGSGLGHVVRCKNSGFLTKTVMGTVRIPTVKLPSLEWELRFYPSLGISDGTYGNSDVLTNRPFVPTRVSNTTLLCEYMYPSDIGPGKVKGCLISEFDDVCYVFTLDRSVPIDYNKYCNLFEQELENF